MIEAALPKESVARRAKMLALVGEEALETFVAAINTSTIRFGISWDPCLEVRVVLWLKACFDFWIVKTEICLDLVTETPEKNVSIWRTRGYAKIDLLTLQMDG
jgi:hypothetical protein